MTGIAHAPTASSAITYGYTFDAASRISTFTTPEGPNTLALDATDQLKSASLTKESYTYDNTGNRTGTGLVTDKGNRLLSGSRACSCFTVTRRSAAPRPSRPPPLIAKKSRPRVGATLWLTAAACSEQSRR
ncbi:MAG: hypothetical protein NT171_08230 [Planctomycetota bacterium]|nr:hypothetical protein [Planctomycetota bacterium]